MRPKTRIFQSGLFRLGIGLYLLSMGPLVLLYISKNAPAWIITTFATVAYYFRWPSVILMGLGLVLALKRGQSAGSSHVSQNGPWSLD